MKKSKDAHGVNLRKGVNTKKGKKERGINYRSGEMLFGEATTCKSNLSSICQCL